MIPDEDEVRSQSLGEKLDCILYFSPAWTRMNDLQRCHIDIK